MKNSTRREFRKTASAISAIALMTAGMAAQATPTSLFSGLGITPTPLITAGAPPDTPTTRIDPNEPTSPFSGVVSINIRYDGLSYICSGTAISPWHVLTAGHCVDTNGQGSVIDINKPGNDVRVVFNSESTPGSDGRAIITANQVTMNPNYQGFGVCPPGVNSFCVNDDIAILRLPRAIPLSSKWYKLSNQQLAEGSIITMAGYGTSGDGWNGYNVSPAFRVKRSGKNVYDFADHNDEAGFDPNSPAEVWYADFDGTGPDGTVYDSFCDPSVLGVAVCGASLGNDVEANIGGGDSGGPSFIDDGSGNLLLVANNTFGFHLDTGLPKGAFGDGMGGVLLYSYLDWIRATAVPEPGTLALLGLGLLGIGATQRRRLSA